MASVFQLSALTGFGWVLIGHGLANEVSQAVFIKDLFLWAHYAPRPDLACPPLRLCITECLCALLLQSPPNNCPWFFAAIIER